MITKIEIKNFKSFGKKRVNINLKPLTIFLGSNGAGKSNILESLGIISQSIGNTSLNIKGKFFNYKNKSNIIFKGETENELSIYIGFKPITEEIKYYKNKLDILIDSIMKIGHNVIRKEVYAIFNEIMNLNSFGYQCFFVPSYEDISQVLYINNTKFICVTWRHTNRKDIYKSKYIYPPILEKSTPHNPREILSEILFEPDLNKPDNFLKGYPRIKMNEKEIDDFFLKMARLLLEVAEMIRKLISERLQSKLYYISTLRGSINYFVSTGISENELKQNGIGMKGKNLVELLSLIFSERKYERVAEKISLYAEKFGIKGLKAGWSGENSLKGDFIENELENLLNLALASYGSKQILSVITQLFWCEEGSTILIEEPETSLHPESQAKLTTLFADAISEGKQIIITTHSDFLPRTLIRPIRDGLIKIEDIAVYEVNKKSDGSVVEELKLNDSGFIKGWIPSFSKIEGELLKEWGKTLPEE